MGEFLEPISEEQEKPYIRQTFPSEDYELVLPETIQHQIPEYCGPLSQCKCRRRLRLKFELRVCFSHHKYLSYVVNLNIAPLEKKSYWTNIDAN